MSLPQIIEIIVMILVPLYLWWLQKRYEELKENEKELIKTINQMINNRVLLTERKLNTYEININKIEELVRNRFEIFELKYETLKEKLNDLENFNVKYGYQIRHTRNIDN